LIDTTSFVATEISFSLLKEWLKWALDTAEGHRIEEPPSQPLEERLRNLDVLEQFTKDQLVGNFQWLCLCRR